MPGFKTTGLLLEMSVVSRLMTRTVAWTGGYNLLISIIAASRYGIFELMLVKSVVSTESISVISFIKHSGCLSSSTNNQDTMEEMLWWPADARQETSPKSDRRRTEKIEFGEFRGKFRQRTGSSTACHDCWIVIPKSAFIL